MSEQLDSTFRQLDAVPAPDLWPLVRLDGISIRTKAPSALRRFTVALTALALAGATFVYLVSAFSPDSLREPTPGSSGIGVGSSSSSSSTSSSSTAPATERVPVYESLIRMLATQQGKPRGSVYLRTEICEGAEHLSAMNSQQCGDSFTEAEQADLTSRLSSLGDVIFVESFDDLDIGDEGLNPPDGIFVWVGPLEHDGDVYRAGGGMLCGGKCGQGGAFELKSGETWEWAGSTSWIA